MEKILPLHVLANVSEYNASCICLVSRSKDRSYLSRHVSVRHAQLRSILLSKMLSHHSHGNMSRLFNLPREVCGDNCYIYDPRFVNFLSNRKHLDFMLKRMLLGRELGSHYQSDTSLNEPRQQFRQLMHYWSSPSIGGHTQSNSSLPLDETESRSSRQTSTHDMIRFFEQLAH